MQFQDEASFIKELKAGNKRAVERWYNGAKPSLCAFFRSHVEQEHDIDELVHDTFLSCLSSLPLFRGTSGLYSFMLGVARHELADYWRKKYAKKAIKALPFGAELLSAVAPQKQSDPVIAQVLAKLPCATAELLQLKYIDGYSIQELAARFSVHPHALQSKLYRAKQSFQQLYKELGGEGVGL